MTPTPTHMTSLTASAATFIEIEDAGKAIPETNKIKRDIHTRVSDAAYGIEAAAITAIRSPNGFRRRPWDRPR